MYSLPRTLVTILICSLASTIFAQGAVQLFSDSSCETPTGPSRSLLSNACLETNDTTAISAISLPACDNGNPVLVISDLNYCQRPSVSPETSSGDIGVCLYLPTGAGIGSAGFKCIGVVTTLSSNPGPTTTVESSTSVKSTPTSSQPGKSTSHGDGIGFSDRISLGVGIGIGGGSIVIAILFGVLQLQRRQQRWRHNYLHNQIIASNGEPPDYDNGYEIPAWPRRTY
jgi:hypothetical protein